MTTDPKSARPNPEPLTASRQFGAPPAKVFEAWSSADHLKRWFCPKQLTVPHAMVDFRPGGATEICMRAPNGHEFWSKGHYVEIEPSKKIVFSSSMMGADGTPLFTALTTVIFEEKDGGTLMSVRQEYDIIDDAAYGAIGGAAEGWRTTLDRLEAEVARIA